VTVVFSDLHLRERSEDVCFRVLSHIEELALGNDRSIVFCGDWWHLRYQVNVRLLNRVNELLTRWCGLGISMDFVPGNHDQVDYAGTNALSVFARESIRVWTEAGTRRHPISGLWGFVPYRRNRQVQLDLLNKVLSEKPQVVFAHFGVLGSVMNNGMKDTDGIRAEPHWPLLILGHYHKPQSNEHWMYAGSPYQTNYGEIGNTGGCLLLNAGKASFIPIDVGAPKHFILEWDPSQQENPPTHPGQLRDHVRIDIKATREMIVKGALKGVLDKHGFNEAQVNVIPVDVNREHKFAMEQGESLLQAAERFAYERVVGSEADIGVLLKKLRSWN